MMGLELFNTMILLLLVVAAIVALRVKDLLTASVVFAVYSFLMCLLWAEMEPLMLHLQKQQWVQA